ncbi:MAG: dihydroxyacetone kinase subunit DhaL [Pseudomonadota bacterium]
MSGLGIEDTKARLTAACEAIVAAKDALCAADRAIGDGDHGVGMARGFSAAAEALATKPAATVGDLFKTVGMAVMGKSGGASGAVFGTLFMAAAKPLDGDTLTTSGLADALQEGLEAVKKRGGAQEGQKTVLDAIAPTIAALRTVSGEDITTALKTAAGAAKAGVDATKDMVARTGKARTLGERSKGHVDPGAQSFALIRAAFAGEDATLAG